MSADVAIVILAGGEGRRIGGGKPLKTFGGKRLIDRAVSLARSWSDCVAVAVRDRSQVGAVAAELIHDEDAPGPLGGLISAMKFASAQGRPLVLAMPADMPFLPDDLPQRLSDAIGGKGCAVAQSAGQIHPVCSLWRANLVDEAKNYAASGRRSLKGLAAAVDFTAVGWSAKPVDPFFNVNTSDDLAEAARRNG